MSDSIAVRPRELNEIILSAKHFCTYVMTLDVHINIEKKRVTEVYTPEIAEKLLFRKRNCIKRLQLSYTVY